MSGAGPTPFALVFAPLVERFARIRDGLTAARRNPQDRDAFLLQREVAELLHELRPEQGFGAAMEALAALAHHAYLFWDAGERVEQLGEAELRRLLAGEPRAAATGTRYVRVPPLRVWGASVEGRPAEPLDGWFVTRNGDRIAALAVFGLSPGRDGLTAVEVMGQRPGALLRLDGAPLFSPTLPGGATAGLASLEGEAELLELVWRAEGEG